MNAVILVPVKESARAKSRLSPLLIPQERAMLAWAMFDDLTRALSPLPYPKALVTDSRRAAEYVERLGWQVLWELDQISESVSIDNASKLLATEGAETVLRLPADLPLLQTRDVEEMLKPLAATPSAVLAPSWDRMGTNALLRTPPCVFPSHFGPNSFSLHLREAADRGVPLRVVENPRLALDLDDFTDVARFLSRPAEGETYRTLMKLDIQERLAHHAVQGTPYSGPARNS